MLSIVMKNNSFQKKKDVPVYDWCLCLLVVSVRVVDRIFILRPPVPIKSSERSSLGDSFAPGKSFFLGVSLLTLQEVVGHHS